LKGNQKSYIITFTEIVIIIEKNMEEIRIKLSLQRTFIKKIGN